MARKAKTGATSKVMETMAAVVMKVPAVVATKTRATT